MMRKVICVVLAITMSLVFSVASSAAEQVLEWSNITDVIGGEISFNNTAGRYYFYIEGNTNVERISATVSNKDKHGNLNPWRILCGKYFL